MGVSMLLSVEAAYAQCCLSSVNALGPIYSPYRHSALIDNINNFLTLCKIKIIDILLIQYINYTFFDKITYEDENVSISKNKIHNLPITHARYRQGGGEEDSPLSLPCLIFG